jgi:hypothetical protein
MESAELKDRFAECVDLLLTREVSVTMCEHVRAFVKEYEPLRHVFCEMKDLAAMRHRVEKEKIAFQKAAKKHAVFTRQWLGLLSPCSDSTHGAKRVREANEDIVQVCETYIESIRENVERIDKMWHLDKRHLDFAQMTLCGMVDSWASNSSRERLVEHVQSFIPIKCHMSSTRSEWSIWSMDVKILMDVELCFAMALLRVCDTHSCFSSQFTTGCKVMSKCVYKARSLLMKSDTISTCGTSFIFPSKWIETVDQIFDKEQREDRVWFSCDQEKIAWWLDDTHHQPETPHISFKALLDKKSRDCRYTMQCVEESVEEYTSIRRTYIRHLAYQHKPGASYKSLPSRAPESVHKFVQYKEVMDTQTRKLQCIESDIEALYKKVEDVDFAPIWNLDPRDASRPCQIDAPKYDVIRCHVPNCMGFVNNMLNHLSTGRCSVCNTVYCSTCWSHVHGEEHQCLEAEKKNVQEIKNSAVSTQCRRCRTIHHREEGCDELFCLFCKKGFNFETGKELVNSDSPDWREYMSNDKFPVPWMCPPLDWKKIHDTWETVIGPVASGGSSDDDMDLRGEMLALMCKKMARLWRHACEIGVEERDDILFVKMKMQLLKSILFEVTGLRDSQVKEALDEVYDIADYVRFLHVQYEAQRVRLRIGEEVVAMAFDRQTVSTERCEALLKEFKDMCDRCDFGNIVIPQI